MKAIAQILLCIVVLAPAATFGQKFKVDDLQTRAMYQIVDFDFDAFARGRIARLDGAGWKAIRHHPGAADLAVNELAERWRSRVAGLDPEAPIRLGQAIRLMPWSEKLGGLPLPHNVLLPVYGVANPVGGAGMPDGFRMLVANSEMLDVWPMSQAEAEKRIESWSTKGKSPKMLWLTVEVDVLEFQQDRNFQVVIRKLALSDVRKRDQVLLERREERPVADIRSSFKLIDGITNPLIPIHTFTVAGIRLQEVMLVPELEAADCRELPRFQGHREFVCEHDWTVNSVPIRMRRRYVGGTLVGIDLLVKQALDAHSVALVTEYLGSEYKLTPPSQQALTCKQYKESWMRYESLALKTREPGTPFFIVRPERWLRDLHQAKCIDGD